MLEFAAFCRRISREAAAGNQLSASTIRDSILKGMDTDVIYIYFIHRVRKKRPPKHVKITLWIENDGHYFSLYYEKPSICNVFVKFHDNRSVHCWDIAFYKKMVENCRRQHCQ